MTSPDSLLKTLRKLLHQSVRKLLAILPREQRFAIYRSFVACDPSPSRSLELKIAETQEELEACFRILHDAYVDSGFMKPHPSGMRVTIYHALPTTTTLCAKVDGRVVGTLSLIRESAMGFPLQAIFDLTEVRSRDGNIAEASALAVHPDFRKTGGAILFPLMKFMYHYCTTFFDTRHLVIAVNPNRIEMYESLLFFQRLTANEVDRYDFANGAPAVGASLDLHLAPSIMRRVYGNKKPAKNLHAYFVDCKLPNIQLPRRRYFTTNDPVMSPAMLDYFFNQRTDTFANLDLRKKVLLHEIYDQGDYTAVLPPLETSAAQAILVRRHERYSFKCKGVLQSDNQRNPEQTIQIVELSLQGFQAHAPESLPLNTWLTFQIHLGPKEISSGRAKAVRENANGFKGLYGFVVETPDLVWTKCVSALQAGRTNADLERASQFMDL